MNVVALIPARAGSKGVAGKNVRDLRGHPLLAYSIAAARASERIDRVIVSTDGEAIAGEARRYGAEVPFLRPARFASDTSPDREFMVHALEWLQQHSESPTLLVHLRPTTPLRSPQMIDAAIDALASSADATSLRSIHEAAESPFKWFTKSGGYLEPFRSQNGDDYSALPRQQVPVVFVPNGYVDVLRPEQILRDPNIYGSKILGFETPSCSEIDTVDDLEFVEFQLRTKGHLLLDVLSRRESRVE